MIPHFDYAQHYNQSKAIYQTMDSETIDITGIGELHDLDEYKDSTFSSINIENTKSLIEDEIAFKGNQFMKEYIETQILDDLQRDDVTQYLNKLIGNINSSYVTVNNFIDVFGCYFFNELHPEIEIDDDGEISFEWYGRIGARANLTFGRNGELYFISLFHGESLKSKFFLNYNNVQIINEKLVELFRDKKV